MDGMRCLLDDLGAFAIKTSHQWLIAVKDDFFIAKWMTVYSSAWWEVSVLVCLPLSIASDSGANAYFFRGHCLNVTRTHLAGIKTAKT